MVQSADVRLVTETRLAQLGGAGGGAQDLSGYAARSETVGVVIHGGSPNLPRPTGFASIQWVGTVQPNNAVAGVDNVVLPNGGSNPPPPTTPDPIEVSG